MNLFAIDEDPAIAAVQACDKHVIKMPTETAQMLAFSAVRHDPAVDWSSFPRRKEDGSPDPYKTQGSHRKHQCTLWVGETLLNWMWAVEHGLALADEYARRYGKVHGAKRIIEWFRDHSTPPPPGPLLPFPQCMPDEFKVPENSVQAYRNFYLGDKARFAAWRIPSEPPSWWTKAI